MSETQEYIVEEWLSVKYQIKIDASSRKEAEEKYLNGAYDDYADREEEESNVDDYKISEVSLSND
tara:strand:- start:468 stop:662 length:195 start_codon:yes stop_codon:yes gene_type:complete